MTAHDFERLLAIHGVKRIGDSEANLTIQRPMEVGDILHADVPTGEFDKWKMPTYRSGWFLFLECLRTLPVEGDLDRFEMEGVWRAVQVTEPAGIHKKIWGEYRSIAAVLAAAEGR